MPEKMIDSPPAAPKKNLQEDGVTNPRDGRGPLRKSADSSTKLPLDRGAQKPGHQH
jgi:hypothetical protein